MLLVLIAHYDLKDTIACESLLRNFQQLFEYQETFPVYALIGPFIRLVKNKLLSVFEIRLFTYFVDMQRIQKD